MTPIEKNINVVDENGNKYGATWPKRAKGLIKNGRARYVSEDTICLARPPEKDEEIKMADNENSDMNRNTADTNDNGRLTIREILDRMDAVAKNTDYLESAIAAIHEIPSGGPGDPGAPGDIAGQGKANALAQIVRQREETNQRLIGFYQKVYDDLTHPEAEAPKRDILRQILDAVSDMDDEEIKADTLTKLIGIVI
jgi:hypothetical protein